MIWVSKKAIFLHVDLIIHSRNIMNFEPTSELISLIYIEMNYSYDIWDISASEHSLGSVNLFY
jgi:hypothetical protein